MPAVLSSITGNGTVPTGGTTGQQLTKNSNTNYDLGWAAAGGGGGIGGSTGATDTAILRASGTGGATLQNSLATIDANGRITAPAGTTAGLYVGAFAGITSGGGSELRMTGAGVNSAIFYADSLRLDSTIFLGWAPSFGATDTAIARNAAGVLEVNNGTAGTYRDLKLRNVILSGGTQIPAASPTGLFLKDDGTYAAPAGGGGGSGDVVGPSSATDNAIARFDTTTGKLIQNSGAIIDDTVAFRLGWNISAGAGETNLYNTYNNGGGQQFSFYDAIGGRLLLLQGGQGNPTLLVFPSAGGINWNSDTGLYRNASGILEINNGTATVLRDLKLAGIFIDSSAWRPEIAALLIDDPAADAIPHIRMRDRSATRYRADFSMLPGGGGFVFNSYDDTGGLYTPVTFDGSPIKFRYGAADTVTVSGTGLDMASGKIITGNGTVPTGGTSGQVLAKNSNTNYDVGWATGGGGGTPGGSNTQIQYNNSGSFGGVSSQTTNGTIVTQQAGANFVLADPTTSTKQAQLDLSNIGAATTRTINIPNANSTTIQPDTGATNNFLTAVSAQGLISKSTSKFLCNSSTATQNPSGNSDVYLTGSMITVAAGDIPVGTQYHFILHIVKTGAGTQAIAFNVRAGTAGSTSDSSMLSQTTGTATGVVDQGIIEGFYTVTGTTSAAVLFGVANLKHNVANGLWNQVAGYFTGVIVSGTSTNITAATKIGVSYNPGASGNHTVTVLRAELVRP